LRVAAVTSGELLNYTNIGRESGVRAKVVRNYFQILEDTLLDFRVQPWRKVRKRRLIETEKFYLFDVGVTNYLSRRTPKIGTPEFGHSFENYMLLELKAYQTYRNPELDIRYWRTSTGFEVDFILGDMQVALEIKASQNVHDAHTRAIRALLEENVVENSIIVLLEKEPRMLEYVVEVLPW
jgi:predicted AAA+ superfamily ATPase